MKKLLVLIVAAVLLGGCTTRTEYGECIGLGESGQKDLHYKLSAWNLAMGVIFVETLVVPVVVAANELSCPVGKT